MRNRLLKLLLLLQVLMLPVAATWAQTRAGGVVFEQAGGARSPLPGVSVVVKGTTTGTVTDQDGHFALSAPAGAALVFSFIGYDNVEMAAGANMEVTMRSNAEELQEVVVTGMTRQDKRLFSGAATRIDAEAAKIDGIADVSRSLEGRAAGVSVQNVSGTFGTAPKIRVRGATSIFGSSKPLWVVDGVIMEDVVEVDASNLSSGDANTLISSAIAGLNSDDIESFQILKDGSATSIYGARAMAGVIVVTTKRGRQGQASISYTGEYSMRLKPSYRDFNIMNSQDQMSVYQEMEQKGWLNYAETANAANSGVYGKMYELISTYDATSGQFGLPNTDEAKAAYLRQAEYRNTDWFDILFSNAVMQNHSISASGGTQRGQYYASLSAMYDPGWYEASTVQRYTLNVNTTFAVSKWIDLSMRGNASFRRQKAPGTLGRTTDPITGEASREFDINPYSYSMNTSRTLDKDTYYTRNYAPFNILHELRNNYIDLNVFDYRASANIDYKPHPTVRLSFLASVKGSHASNEHNVRDESNQAQAYRAMATTAIRDANPRLYRDPDDVYALPVSVLPYGGIYSRTDNQFFGWDTRASVSYNNVFDDTHIVNFYAGMENNSVDRKSTWFRGWGLQYDKGETALYDYRVFKQGQEQNTAYFTMSNTHTRSLAFFATGTYSWRGRYQVTGTWRDEGTNYLGKATSARWLPTWNISGAWNAHEEDWFADVFGDVFTHGTLRASYSLTGDRPPVTNSLPIFTSEAPWRPFTSIQEPGLQMTLGNPDLTYEKKHEVNVGVDLGFISNRLNLTTDVYWRRNSDLIGYVNSPLYGSYVYGNVAEMKSHGVEVSLSSTNIRTPDFTWNTNFIFSWADNEITDLTTHSRVYELVQGEGYSLRGYPVNSVFSIPFAGLNDEGIPMFNGPDGLTTTGIYMQERDPERIAYLKYEGPADPPMTGSLGNILSWRGWTLNVFVTYSFGNVVRLYPAFSYSYDDLDAMPKEFRNRWVRKGDEAVTDIPAIASQRQYYNDSNLGLAYSSYNYSTARIAKGDFIRMKEMSVAYDFPKEWIGGAGLNNLSLKLQGTNLFLFYADKKLNGQDPEFFNTGGVAAPMAKQFTLTLRVGL